MLFTKFKWNLTSSTCITKLKPYQRIADLDKTTIKTKWKR